MGLKFLNLQTILHGYLCLGHANNFPTVAAAAAAKQMVVKVIKSDGMINIYYRPIAASELMLEFPKHLVCDSHSFFIGQKIPTLSPNDKLQLGHNYFLLPAHIFQSVLSFVTIASSFASFNNMATVGAATMTNVQAFDIKKSPSGLLQVRVSDAFVSRLMQQRKMNQEDGQQHQLIEGDEENTKSNKICSTPQLFKEYTQLVSCRLQWKPKLDTIKESKKKKLSTSSFGIKRRKKGHHNQPKNVQQKSQKQKQDNQHQQQHHKITTTKTKTKSKTKAKAKR